MVFLVLEIVFCTLRLENGLGGFSGLLVLFVLECLLICFFFNFHVLYFSYCLPAGAGGCCWGAAGDCWGLLVVAAGGCLLLLGYIDICIYMYVGIFMFT